MRTLRPVVLVTLGMAATLALISGASAGRPEAAASPTPVLSYLPLVLKQPTPTPIPAPGWLGYLNGFRTRTGLNALAEDASWSAGGVLHSRYMVKNDLITHYEDPGNPWYTPEGYDAGVSGNIFVSSWLATADETAIDWWMAAPFHAVSILDPQLHTTGFGSYRENVGIYKMGATLDVSRGRGGLPPGTAFPIPYPGDGAETGLLSFGGYEWPDPLTSCPGYSAPTGPAIILQIGDGSLTTLEVTAHSLHQGGTPLDHCVFDETSYVNPISYDQGIGRLILAGRDAIVVMPRDPLAAGQTYQVSITANGQTHSWSFSTASGASGLQAPAGETIRLGAWPETQHTRS